MDQDDPVDDGCPNDRDAVEEADEILAIIKRVVDSDGKEAQVVYERLKTIVSRAVMPSCLANLGPYKAR